MVLFWAPGFKVLWGTQASVSFVQIVMMSLGEWVSSAVAAPHGRLHHWNVKSHWLCSHESWLMGGIFLRSLVLHVFKSHFLCLHLQVCCLLYKWIIFNSNDFDGVFFYLFFLQRSDIVKATYEPTDEECEWKADEEQELTVSMQLNVTDHKGISEMTTNIRIINMINISVVCKYCSKRLFSFGEHKRRTVFVRLSGETAHIRWSSMILTSKCPYWTRMKWKRRPKWRTRRRTRRRRTPKASPSSG